MVGHSIRLYWLLRSEVVDLVAAVTLDPQDRRTLHDRFKKLLAAKSAEDIFPHRQLPLSIVML